MPRGRQRLYEKSDCMASAKLCLTKAEWRKKFTAHAAAAWRHGWFEECTKHMQQARFGSPKKWSEEKCITSARPYSNVTSWKAGDPGAYAAAKRYGWLNSATAHFKPLGNMKSRVIYAIRVRGTSMVYIGLTQNLKKRLQSHMKSKRFQEVLQNYGEHSIRPFKITKLISVDDARRIECALIEKYIAKGFLVMNSKAGGGLGASTVLWTYDKIKEDAQKYKYLGEWSQKSHAAYTAALHQGFLDQLISEGAITRLVTQAGYWTFDRVQRKAQEFETKSDWYEADRSSHGAAGRSGWLNDPRVTGHMRPRHRWTDAEIEKAVASCTSLSEFREKEGSLYAILKKTHRLDKFTSGLLRQRRAKAWTVSEIFEEALKHKIRGDFQKFGKGAYTAAKREGIFEQAVSHMPRRKKAGT